MGSYEECLLSSGVGGVPHWPDLGCWRLDRTSSAGRPSLTSGLMLRFHPSRCPGHLTDNNKSVNVVVVKAPPVGEAEFSERHSSSGTSSLEPETGVAADSCHRHPRAR